ncbi:MAG: radical SAM protein [Planctomycetales bacterium]|nr:radical SAM protein [Planctomycetales bacterium]
MAEAIRRELLAARGPKNRVDPRRPYAFLVEEERNAAGDLEDVATIFLTNKECPFSCVYCDLWKNTTDASVQPGDIPAQIDYALSRLPPAKTIKLYNSGNFFDPQAIPPQDHPAIISRVKQFDRVIVENHPSLVNEKCVRFRDELGAELEIAMGLETVHPAVLPRLNKQMTVDDFCQAASLLRTHGIHVRAFVLLMPPFMPSDEAVHWAVRSVAVAFQAGAACTAIIPTRGGNGLMEQFAAQGDFSPPTLKMLEESIASSFALPEFQSQSTRVFVDLWDIEKLYTCPDCGPRRKARLAQMNHEQRLLPKINCGCLTPVP